MPNDHRASKSVTPRIESSFSVLVEHYDNDVGKLTKRKKLPNTRGNNEQNPRGKVEKHVPLAE